MSTTVVPTGLEAAEPSVSACHAAAKRSVTERLRQQLVRYETLFTLLDDLRTKEDLVSIGQLVAARWKYLANIGSWRLVVPGDTGCSVVDGSRGLANVYDLNTFQAWDQHHWQATRPCLLKPDDMQGSPPPPLHLATTIHREWLVIPFDHQGQRVGLLTLGVKDEPLSEMDNKFIRLFGSQLVDHVFLVQMRQRELQRLQSLARRDALTGVLNRAGIMDAAATQLAAAARSGQAVSVVMVDVDHFKTINDTHGHPVGDAVLRELAHRFTSLTRTGELVGRFGGEEFVLVLSPCGSDMALKVAERMRAAIADHPFDIGMGAGLTLPVTVSLGVAGCENGADTTLEELIRCADEALYAAKRTGRNRAMLYGAGPISQPRS